MIKDYESLDFIHCSVKEQVIFITVFQKSYIRSLKCLLEEDEDEVVDTLFLDFTVIQFLWFTCIIVHNCYFKTYIFAVIYLLQVKGQELIPNGNQIPVTKVNR